MCVSEQLDVFSQAKQAQGTNSRSRKESFVIVITLRPAGAPAFAVSPQKGTSPVTYTSMPWLCSFFVLHVNAVTGCSHITVERVLEVTFGH